MGDSLIPMGKFTRLCTLACVVFAGVAAAQSLTDLPLDLGRYRGRVVVVDFWASWCEPCRRSIPWLNAMKAKYGDDGLVIVGVNVDKERRDAVRFLASTPADFQIVFDPEGRLPARYAVKAMPSSFVFDRNGKLVDTHLGFQTMKREEYEATLRKLVLQRETP
jgi:cytochrome c biogenesis protein CcmG/thiol:disulfide interchange protein DsbE